MTYYEALTYPQELMFAAFALDPQQDETRLFPIETTVVPVTVDAPGVNNKDPMIGGRSQSHPASQPLLTIIHDIWSKTRN